MTTASEVGVCDPHHHLVDKRRYLYTIDDFRADVRGSPVTQTVFVECTSAYHHDGPEGLRPVGETEWVASLTTGDGFMDGIVGFADLMAGEKVTDVLAAHLIAGAGRFCGIRHASALHPNPDVQDAHTNPPSGMLGLRSFRAGIAALGAAGLSFDAWLYFPQLPELAALARHFPEVSIVLDHLGGPVGLGPASRDRDEVRMSWKASMEDLSRCPNVFVKLGGIGMPRLGTDWNTRASKPSSEEVAETWGDDIRFVIDTFSPSRCMFESNFPVDAVSFSYRTCWDAFFRIAEGYDDHERQALFHDTATTVYRLP